MKTIKYFKSLLVLFMVFATTVAFAITAPVIVNTYDSDGNAIAGKFKIWKGPNYVGEYDAGTSVQLDVGSSYKLFAHYQRTSTARVTFTVNASGNTFNYSTTKITFHWSGGYLDYRGDGSWKSFGKTGGVWNSRELFPKDFYGNPMKFQFGLVWNDPRTMVVEMDYSGQSSIEKVVSQLQLLDHNGDPLAGGIARGGYATPTSWHVSGVTNAKGLLLDMRDGSNTNLSYEMQYNKTTKWSAQQTSSIYSFQTNLLSLRLETCGGTPLDGGHPRYGAGSSYGSYHWPNGNTGWSNPGETTAEFFPGTYSFEMGYQSTADQKISVVIPDANTSLTWTTTNVTLNYAGSISYGGSSGDSRYFNKPSMELMAGTYKFHFRYQSRQDITISGCELGKTAVLIKLEASNGNGLEGGIVTYYKSGWKSAGTTDANGEVFTMIDGAATKYSFRMKWAGYSQQLSNVDITVTKPVLFKTIPMVARLESSSGADLPDGVATYYASGWKSLGTTLADGNTAPVELLPGKYSFRMKYLGYSQQKSNIIITTTNPVVFATTPMVVELHDSDDNLMDDGVVTYYASGWKSFGTTSGGTVSKELLPGKYSFRLKYEGYSLQKSNVLVNGDSPLVYKTEKMMVLLKDSDGNLMDAGVVIYYASGWKSFGTTSGGTVTKQLLPGKYSFRMKYEGYSLQKSNVNIATENPLVYQTIPMVVSLQTCTPVGLAGGDVIYYASGWKTFGTTDASGDATKELLPGKYSFRMKYIGQSNQKSNIILVSNNPLIYNTTNVALSYNGTIKYYASGWKLFTQPSMEMLPHNYPFRFDNKNQTNINVTGCNVSQGWVLLTVLDENGNGVPGGKAKPAYGGSWGAVLPGQTDAAGKLFSELPPGYTKIQMAVNQGSKEQLLAALLASNYTWNTEILRIWLNDHTGSAITDGSAVLEQGGGTWYNWGNLNTSGYLDIPLFARTGAYKFRINYNYTSETKFPVVSANAGIDNYYFQTGQVIGACITKYAAGSWKTFTDGMELMPGTRNFKDPYQSGTVTAGGITTLSCTKSASAHLAGSYETILNKMYPNPFSTITTLEFSIDQEQKVIVAVFDLRGRLIKTLVNQNLSEGEHTINWNSQDESGGDIKQGIYIIKLITANAVDQKTIVKMK